MRHTDDSLSKLICYKFGMAHKKDVLKIIQWVFKFNIYEIMFKGGIIPFVYLKVDF